MVVSADDGGADLGDYASESAAPATAFHPTDALLIGGNGGFNPSADDGGADLGEYQKFKFFSIYDLIFIHQAVKFIHEWEKIDEKKNTCQFANWIFSSSALIADDAFHPTDALLIGGNGGFNPTGEGKGADLGGY